jgi:hypothetical protein
MATAPAPAPEAAMAPIELPISRGARWARILAVLALDVVLASAGVAMILSFARDCEAARGSASAPPAAAPGSEVHEDAAPSSGTRPAPEVRP